MNWKRGGLWWVSMARFRMENGEAAKMWTTNLFLTKLRLSTTLGSLSFRTLWVPGIVDVDRSSIRCYTNQKSYPNLNLIAILHSDPIESWLRIMSSRQRGYPWPKQLMPSKYFQLFIFAFRTDDKFPVEVPRIARDLWNIKYRNWFLKIFHSRVRGPVSSSKCDFIWESATRTAIFTCDRRISQRWQFLFLGFAKQKLIEY